MAALSKLLAGVACLAPNAVTLQHFKVLLAACVAIAVFTKFNSIRYQNAKNRTQTSDDISGVIEQQTGATDYIKPTKKTQTSANKVFFKRMLSMISILVPGLFTPETGYLLLVAVSVVATTYSDLWVIANTSHIQGNIVARDHDGYMKHIMAYIYAMPLMSLADKLLSLSLAELKLRFRTRLTKYLYNKYLQGYTYYQMSNLDNRISNPDQLLTQDTEKFCDSVAELYCKLIKPLLAITVYASRTTSRLGLLAPCSMVCYIMISGSVVSRLRQPLGRLTAKEQKLEGEFRYVNSRLITNSEEVAFYNGNRKERQILLSSFDTLKNHIRRFIQYKFIEGIFSNLLTRYGATLVGRILMGGSLLNARSSGSLTSTIKKRVEDYHQNGAMLLKLAESIGMLAAAGREMATLAGFTARITKLLQVLDDLNKGRYQRTMVTDSSRDSQSKLANLKPGSGKVRHQDYIIRFDHVPLVTPNGDVLVEDMTFEVKSGVNVLVCGPNGCGKSSLFRVLAELWPLFGGTLTKPEKEKLFYIPQRPYMTLGTLRDQIIYPDTKDDMRRKRISDSHLVTYLDKVQLGYILEREGGWESVQDWMDVLSGGEKQRIAMARLFYHNPQFAILDECTSAVSVDVEGAMYQYCKDSNITLFTISHRKSLLTHHEYYLRMDDKGGCCYQPITDEELDFE